MNPDYGAAREYLIALLHPNYSGPMQLVNRETGEPAGPPGLGLMEAMIRRPDPPASWGGLQTPEQREQVQSRGDLLAGLLDPGSIA